MTIPNLLFRGIATLFLASILRPAIAEEILMSDWVIEQVTRSHEVDGSKSVTIVNPYGDIRVRGGDDKEISLYATLQHHTDDTETPEFIFIRDGDRLELETSYPDVADNPLPQRFSKRRTDIALFVPSGLRLTLKTLDGRAESKGHKGHLVIEARAGQIIAATKGVVEARTESGDIRIEFRNRDWRGPSTIESISGDINVFMMSDPHVTVDIDTAGTITTDYSIEISHTPGSSRKIARAVIGDGKHSLSIGNIAGAVRLGRVFDMIPVDPPSTESSGEGSESGG